MNSLWVCLCAVLLSVSAQGYNFSANGWSVSGADEVSAVEGDSAVLPCTFTHPPTDLTLTGSVIWFRRKRESDADKPVFNCTYPNSGPSRCDGATQEAGGGRFRLVGNLRQRDASIMVERLSREDGGRYRCRVKLNVGTFQTLILTALSVRAPDGNGSVVTGTEGSSATLPCVFTRYQFYHNLHTVTWVRKDPYRHIVTFRHHRNGSWAAENGVTRYELVGDPEQGKASTRIKQLSAEDSDGYLCLVEFRKPDYYRYPFFGHNPDYKIDHPFIHLSQCEVRLRVRAVSKAFPVVILCTPLGLKTLALLVICVVFYSEKRRKGRD